jgi:hypothetical protein
MLAIHMLKMMIGKYPRQNTEQCETVYEMLETLESIYGGNALQDRVTLLKRLMQVRFKPWNHTDLHVAEFNLMLAELKNQTVSL